MFFTSSYSRIALLLVICVLLTTVGFLVGFDRAIEFAYTKTMDAPSANTTDSVEGLELLSASQETFALIFILLLIVSLAKEVVEIVRKSCTGLDPWAVVETATGHTQDARHHGHSHSSDDTSTRAVSGDVAETTVSNAEIAQVEEKKQHIDTAIVPAPPPVAVAATAAAGGHGGGGPVSHLQALRAIVLLMGVVMIMLIVDGPLPWHSLLAVPKQAYSRDLFSFMCIIVVLAAGLTLRDTTKNDTKPLHREMTDEWRGFMQIGFVLYHYFAAKEAYNLIRIFIASYVFLTGFGNFSFFWVKRDFTILRVLKMLLRLNLLVILICFAMNKPWMLYYVCPLHTFNFFVVYAAMAIMPHKNVEPKWMMAKFACVFIFLFVLFDIPGVFDFVFAPFFPLVQFNDSMYEWRFRSTLDHYAVLWGMITAYNYPTLERWLYAIEARIWRERFQIKAILAICASTAMFVWFYYCFFMNKKIYNSIHPYISFGPILAYIVLRNLSHDWRGKVLGLFAYSGRITLETYLLQFHMWLSNDAKGLMQYIPATTYPLLNFLIASVVYIVLSNWCFEATIKLNDWLVPHDATIPTVLRRFGLIVAGSTIVYLVVLIVRAAIIF